MKTVKKFDVIIIVVLLVISIVPFLIFKGYMSSQEEKDVYYANITIDGKPYKSIRLDKDLNEEFKITTEDGYNTVFVRNGEIAIVDADCADSVCIYQGFINSPGHQIVCLPHKLIITIEGKAAVSDGEDAIAK